MTPDRVLEVIGTYREFFVEYGFSKIDYPHDDLLVGALPAIEHCHGMLDRMVEFVHEGRMDKAFRWLGFIQGVLWTTGYYSLTELKNHNKPPE